MARVTRGLGYRSDRPDDRDHRYERVGAVFVRQPGLIAAVSPGIIYDLRDTLPGPLDQLALGSCASHAAAKILYNGQLRALGVGAPPPPLASRLSLYLFGRASDGDIFADTGTTLRAVLAGANKLGFPPESLWPYDIEKYTLMPPTRAFEIGYDESGPRCNYQRLSDDPQERLADIDHALASGLPVAFGTDVTQSFVDSPDPVVLPPEPGEKIAGGHAMIVAGKRADGAYLVASSWGTEWGDGGYCWMAPGYLTASVSRDFWVTPVVAPYKGLQ